MAGAALSARTARAAALAIALLAIAARPAFAAPADSVLVREVRALEAGAWIRVERSGTSAEGELQRAGRESLVVEADDGAHRFALETIDRLWVEERATRSAARAGLVAGGLTGGFLGVLYAGVCNDFGDSCTELVPIGAAVFGAGGWLVGKVVGSAVPRWRRVYVREGVSTAASPNEAMIVPRPRILGPRIGSIQFQIGYARSPDAGAPRGGTAVRASLLAWWHDRVAIGPEAAYAGLGRNENVGLIGGVARVGLGARIAPRVELVAGLGAYHWSFDVNDYAELPETSLPAGETLRFFGGSVGVAGRFPIGGRLYSGIALRVHHDLQRLDQPRDFGLVTVTAGIERAW